MGNGDTHAVVDWLVEGARSASDMPLVVSSLCDRLLDCGFPIGRVGVFVLTLHPQVMGERFLWKPGAPLDVNSAPFEAFQTDAFRKSAVRRVIDTGMPVRRRLADPDCPVDFMMLPELRAQGVTDYLAIPLAFADGTIHGATFATQHPDGFAEEQIKGLESIAAPLSRVVEHRALRCTASTLLDVYVGNQAGARILSGQIRRGHVDGINAVVWFSDMRGFSILGDRLTPHDLVDLLNRYFDCQVPAILDHGGEVLEYMGDGLLAAFLLPPEREKIQGVCMAALSAAREARKAVVRLSTRVAARSASGKSDGSESRGPNGVQFGLALHLGQVAYGNIGSRNRLKFTCVGSVMNLAARIEGLTARLHRTILASEEFARQCPSDFMPVGEFDLKGYATARTVFGLREESGGSVQ